MINIKEHARLIISCFYFSLLLFAFQSCNNESVEPIVIIDTDNDGIPDNVDNCSQTSNPNQEDSDNDDIGDACDNDADNDGITDDLDNCPTTHNPNQDDDDIDGIGNVCDDDFVDPMQPLAYCENGMADIYPCNDYDLMSHIPLSEFNTTNGNDIWGWVDPIDNKEYAIMGVFNGTVFVDITDPVNPVYLGRLNTQTVANVWRDIKIYNNYAFIVADNASNHGMQIFDLTKLRDVTNPPQSFTPDTVYTDVGSCHNVVINESESIAYLVGCDTFNGGPVFVDISDPLNPISLGGYGDAGYSHDAQVVTYNGSDPDYIGKEIYVGSNERSGTVVILDVTDKDNVTIISSISYPQASITHQGWFTENHDYFIVGDEGDEGSFGFNTRTLVFDFKDLDSPILSYSYAGPTTAIDHNGYVKGNTFFLANYTAGVRMIDITNIDNSEMNDVGFFDTYPENDTANFNGAWSVYPYFPSGNIIVSDINRGLFVIRKSSL